ncbi:MAG: GTP cyclohydrolase I FolE [Lachnospiraceae bacterium]|nr:GTP cyclohydrolase I FolE [Lachnospiraceae bacterium]
MISSSAVAHSLSSGRFGRDFLQRKACSVIITAIRRRCGDRTGIQGEIRLDHEKIEAAVRLLLEGIGEDPEREGLKDTPARISAMCEEIFGGLGEDASRDLAKTFSSGCSDLVVEKDIRFYSVCEHHLLPFFGTCTVAYVPDGRVVGLSKLARTVEVYARRPQIQEQLTAQIADAVMRELAPKGVIVKMKAEHLCMSMRGVKKPGTQTVTMARRGVCAEDDSLLATFFAMENE